VRLFVAVDPGERFRRELSTRLDPWRARLRVAWVAEPNLHVTLRFLGELSEAAVPRLAAALRQAASGHAPLRLQPGRVGAFPSLRAPRVLFLQMESGGALERLAFGLEQQYVDNWGKTHVAGLEAALTFLAEKGVLIDPASAVPASDTLVVSEDAQPDRFSVTISTSRGDADAVTHEMAQDRRCHGAAHGIQGTREQHRLRPVALA